MKEYTISIGRNSYDCVSIGVCCNENEIEDIAMSIANYYLKNEYNGYACVGYNEGNHCKVGEYMENILIDIM